MTNRTAILTYLRYKDFTPSGVMARDIHEITGSKEATIERTARLLCAEGKLDAKYEEVGVHFIYYKLAKVTLF